MENRSPRDTLVYWINEREKIRIFKEHKTSPPWSKDKTMQETYFCNIHREDDRVTKWIRERWSQQCEQPHIQAEPNMCMSRLVNRIESLERLGWPWTHWNSPMFKMVASELKPFWGNAYVVTTHGQAMSKVDYACGVLDRVFEPNLALTPNNTLEAYHKAIMQHEGFGSFMAGQVVADLKNTPGHPLKDAADWWTWCCHGPGSLRGLNWMVPTELLPYKVTPTTFHMAINEVWWDVKDDVPKMCMQDFQNCLCEFDKYMRVSTGAGRSKRRYKNGV